MTTRADPDRFEVLTPCVEPVVAHDHLEPGPPVWMRRPQRGLGVGGCFVGGEPGPQTHVVGVLVTVVTVGTVVTEFFDADGVEVVEIRGGKVGFVGWDGEFDDGVAPLIRRRETFDEEESLERDQGVVRQCPRGIAREGPHPIHGVGPKVLVGLAPMGHITERLALRVDHWPGHIRHSHDRRFHGLNASEGPTGRVMHDPLPTNRRDLAGFEPHGVVEVEGGRLASGQHESAEAFPQRAGMGETVGDSIRDIGIVHPDVVARRRP